MGRPWYVTLPTPLDGASVVRDAPKPYVTVFVVTEDWLGLSTATGLANAAAFSALALVSLASPSSEIREECLDPLPPM